VTGSATVADFEELSVDDLSRNFGRRRALSRVSFRCSSGSILGLLGPNGAGKSTLLAILATLLRPTSGTIRYGRIGTINEHGMDRGAGLPDGNRRAGPFGPADLRAALGMLGHDLYLYPELTARENLAFFAGLYGAADAGAAADRALARAALSDRGNDPVGRFSRGMRQRVALERALIHEPHLLLLDEPFTGLDDRSVVALSRRLRELREEGRIVVLATHDLDLAEGLFDHVVFLREGRMVDTRERPQALRSLYQAVMAREHS